MLLMNDGELAHRLAHPGYGVLKTYLADVAGPLPRDLGRQLVTGISLMTGGEPDRFRVVERAGSRALVEITLHEGRKHIVRRMLAEPGTRSVGSSGPRLARFRWGRCGRVPPGNSAPGKSASCTRR